MASSVKKSVSVPDVIWAAAEEEAANDHTTVSALIAEGLENLLSIRAGQRAVREWERENGALTAEELAEADALLDGSDVGEKHGDVGGNSEGPDLRLRRTHRRRAERAEDVGAAQARS